MSGYLDAPDPPLFTRIDPMGLGGFVAFERALSPGGKADDLKTAITRCLDAGMSWIAPRAGAGGANDAAFDEASVAAYLAAGLKVYPWIFPYRGTEKQVAAGFRRFFVAGATGAIINAEFEYQPATPADARNLVTLIRSVWAEAQGERDRRGLSITADHPCIMHAPPDYLGAGVGHPLSDELVALDEVCDAILPQVYAYEHDDAGHVVHLERVAKGYEKRGVDLSRVWWVGCTYRPAARAGKKLAPLPPEVIAADVRLFLEHELVRTCRAPSLYSLDALEWINGPGDRVMAMLRDWRKSNASTSPGSPIGKRKNSQRLIAVREPLADLSLDSPATPLRAGEGEHTPAHLRDNEDD